jgi:IclR family transcriptional regulator, KDG regulon repressor
MPHASRSALARAERPPARLSGPAPSRPRAPAAAQIYRVAAVDSALKLLMLVSEQPGLGVSDLARRSGTTKARAFRLLQTLEAAGLIRKEASHPAYRLGYQALYLGSRARDQLDLVRLAQPVLAEIGRRSEETVQLRVRQGKESVCIAKWEPEKIVRYHARIGQGNALHAGAAKLLLAYAPSRLQEEVLSGRLSSLTPDTPVEVERLKQELARIRAQGYCISQRETDPEAVSAGAPVWDASHMAVAAFIIGAPASRTTRTRLAELAKLAVHGAAIVSRALGGAG